MGQVQAVPLVGAVRSLDAGLDVGGDPPQAVAAPLPRQHDRRLLDRGLVEPTRDLAEVDALGHLEPAGSPRTPRLTDDAGQAEDPLVLAVGVEPDDVPAAGVADDPPRLEVACARLVAGA